MTGPFVSIILRSFNEGWALRETLPALQAQAVLQPGSRVETGELVVRWE